VRDSGPTGKLLTQKILDLSVFINISLIIWALSSFAVVILGFLNQVRFPRLKILHFTQPPLTRRPSCYSPHHKCAGSTYKMAIFSKTRFDTTKSSQNESTLPNTVLIKNVLLQSRVNMKNANIYQWIVANPRIRKFGHQWPLKRLSWVCCSSDLGLE
jgi:hypothetical protein